MRIALMVAAMLVWLAPSTAHAEESQGPADVAEGSTVEWGVDGPYVLDIGLSLGLGRRLDEPPIYELTERNGLLLGGGLDFFVSRRVSFGLGYEHLDLGTERSGLRLGGSASLTRDLNSLRANMRLYPWRGDVVGAYMRIGLATVWQSADLVASVWSPETPGENVSFECEGAAGVSFGMGVEAGLDVALSDTMRFIGALGIDGHRLTSDALEGCAPGAGTVSVFMLRSGLVYGLPL